MPGGALATCGRNVCDSMREKLDLDNWSDEFEQEARHLEQAGEEVVEEVHDEAFDVGAVVILVCHDHEVAVPQLLGIVIQLQQASEQYCQHAL